LRQFCTDECLDDPTQAAMVSNAELLLGMNQTHFEYTQLLRYEENQYYQIHNDFISSHLNMPMGPRILTLFVYLSGVEEGGGTHFPELNVTVEAKPGRAVLWPSVYSDEPRTNDPRSDHEALPVIRGRKYGCNIWAHARDYKASFARDCG
jgi:prolyl 4-hydroxylase